MLDLSQFTETEKRILTLLSDGKAHSRQEIFENCIADPMAHPKHSVWQHVSNTRKKLRPIGQTIVCELQYRKACYRHVIMIGNI